jgi:hypothetical protein
MQNEIMISPISNCDANINTRLSMIKQHDSQRFELSRFNKSTSVELISKSSIVVIELNSLELISTLIILYRPFFFLF